MSEDRDTALAQAERLIRRGELREALAALLALVRQHPADEHLKQRLVAVRSLVDDPPKQPPKTGSFPPEQVAEAFAAKGDLKSAVAIYEKLHQFRPDHVPTRERLAHFRALTRPPSAPTPAPVPAPLPSDPRALLEELLRRVAAAPRRR
jgi:tetratricopeptide (TPR) repeat protein